MLELRKMREWTPEGSSTPKAYDKGFEPPVYFKDLNDFKDNHEKVVAAIEENERYNLFVTCNNIVEGATSRKESWKDQNLIMWDIDGVTEGDRKKPEAYLEALSFSTGAPISSLFCISTGGGFHIVQWIKETITSRKYFDENSINYQILCINTLAKFKEMGLSGECDRAVFAPNRMFRVPGSISRKSTREDRIVSLCDRSSSTQKGLTPASFNIAASTGLPQLKTEADFMSDKELSYIKVDSETVEQGCEFLKFAKECQSEVNEGQWYAMLSIIGRLESGDKLVHEYSKHHPSYSADNTTVKTTQSIEASGPRTCDNIDKLWTGCAKCPNYKKVRSPISLKGEDFIATEHSGFHTITPKGKLIPQYDDLMKFYGREGAYINSAGMHFKFDKGFWNEKERISIDAYAEQNFSPAPKNTMCSEFRGKVERTNLRDANWFGASTNRLINFKNGVLNLDTLELKEHSPEYGFKSVLPFDYDPDAQCPEFRKMLSNVCSGDPEKQNVLMEFLGYGISNDEPKADKILVLTGEGQNGKSRFLNVWKALGGTGTRYLSATDVMNPFMLQRLDGGLFNIMEELPSFQKKEFWELMKHLTTGGQLTVSRKFKDPYEFHNKAKMIMTCNTLPQGAEQNHGYFRRLLIVPFEARFSSENGNIDKDIDARVIANEMSGVANIAIKMYHRLKANNYEFTKSKAVDKTLADYRESVDSVQRWFEEHVELDRTEAADGALDSFVNDDEGCYLILEELSNNYSNWCQSNRERPVSTRQFTSRLIQYLVDTKKISFDDRINPKHSKLVNGQHVVIKKRARVTGGRKVVIGGLRYIDENMSRNVEMLN